MQRQFIAGGVCGVAAGLLVGGMTVSGWMQKPQPQPEETAATRQAGPTPATGSSVSGAAKVVTQLGPVQPGEVLRLEVFELMQPGQWSRELMRVDEAGEVLVLGINKRIEVGGLSLSKVEDLVAKALVEGQVLPSNPPPSVRVFRAANADGTISPLFELATPGK